MKKEQLKSILKPLIKQCIKEVIFEEGVLSGIISEVVKGVGPQQKIVESTTEPQKPSWDNTVRNKQRKEEIKVKMAESRKKLTEAMAKGALGDVDVFENVDPISENGSGQGALSGISSTDAGININNIPGAANWKALAKGK
tara:strand:- start:1408 stop:1830 length:423 start_codon:yes stop_codon:yes gene_type:complete